MLDPMVIIAVIAFSQITPQAEAIINKRKTPVSAMRMAGKYFSRILKRLSV